MAAEGSLIGILAKDALCQHRVPVFSIFPADGIGDGIHGAYQYAEFLCPCDAGIEQVALEHDEVAAVYGYNHYRILGAL